MNNNGTTIVYVNGTEFFTSTGLQTGTILLDHIAFGNANVTVVYEAAGRMCSFRDEKLVEGQLVISSSCFHFLMHNCVCSLSCMPEYIPSSIIVCLGNSVSKNTVGEH